MNAPGQNPVFSATAYNYYRNVSALTTQPWLHRKDDLSYTSSEMNKYLQYLKLKMHYFDGRLQQEDAEKLQQIINYFAETGYYSSRLKQKVLMEIMPAISKDAVIQKLGEQLKLYGINPRTKVIFSGTKNIYSPFLNKPVTAYIFTLPDYHGSQIYVNTRSGKVESFNNQYSTQNFP